MRAMKAMFLGIVISLMLTMVALSAHAEQMVSMCLEPEYSYTTLYSHTEDISAGLSFSGNVATCKGEIHPMYYEDVTITVSLYKQSGTSWILLDSWSSSAKGGRKAYVSGTKNVDSGTYKVVTTGNVGGLEFPTASITKTKP